MAENHEITTTGRMSPFICVDEGARAIEYYRSVFGAVVLDRDDDADGKVSHAELAIGNDLIMLADEFPDHGFLSPKTIGGTPVILHLYVEDVDSVAARMIELGGTVINPVEDRFFGDRSGKLRDPFGHVWIVATRKEELSREEKDRRAAEVSAAGA